MRTFGKKLLIVILSLFGALLVQAQEAGHILTLPDALECQDGPATLPPGA